MLFFTDPNKIPDNANGMEKGYSHSIKLRYNLSKSDNVYQWSPFISVQHSFKDVNLGRYSDKYRILKTSKTVMSFEFLKWLSALSMYTTRQIVKCYWWSGASTQQRKKGLFMLSGFSLHIFGISEGLHDISDKENVTYLQGRRVLMPKASCDLSHSVLRLPTMLRQSSE